MSFRSSRPVLVVLVSLVGAGCDEQKSAPAEVELKNNNSLADHAEVTTGTSAKTKDGEKAAKADGDCLSGKYRFNYADFPLQKLMTDSLGDKKVLKNDGAAPKVEKQSGSADCEFTPAPKNSWSCSIKEPFLAEISFAQAGMNMAMKMEMSGTAAMTFALLSEQRLQIKSTDSSAFHVKGTMTVAGQVVDFPAGEIPQAFGENDSTWSYQCQGDRLLLSAQIKELPGLVYPMTRIK